MATMLLDAPTGAVTLDGMAKEKPQGRPPARPDHVPGKRSGKALNVRINSNVKAALDAYVQDFNDKNDLNTTQAMHVEKAIKTFLSAHGFWPYPPPA